jgi:transcriptional regulator with GAF, ATPase, and Fis domain
MLRKLIEIGKRLLTETNITSVLTVAIDGAIEITGAERGMIILFGEGKEILFETARHIEKEDIVNPKFEISQTIIDQVKSEGASIYLHNALEDPRFATSESVDQLRILSILCLPLKHNGKTFGVVYLDNRTVVGAFEPEIFEFTENFTDFISLAAYHALERRDMQNRQVELEKELRSRFDFEAIIGNSPKMMKVLQLVSQVAETDVPVLLEGETGIGKELAARAIHFNSKRREMQLVSINCGAIPENLLESEIFGHEKGAFTGAVKRHKGKFEQAEGGTIFLDEVDEMSPALQVKLLRILQWGEFSLLGSDGNRQCDVRVVAASKQQLKQLVDEGKFRDDLYYRLNLIRIELPSLRERKEDILVLVKFFLEQACKEYSKTVPNISSEVEQTLLDYDFPGNVRELENIIKRVAILCDGDCVELNHLPPEIQPNYSSDLSEKTNQNFQEAKLKAVEDFERRYLQRVLAESDGVVRKAAEVSGMFQANFHAKLKKYGINAKNYKK